MKNYTTNLEIVSVLESDLYLNDDDFDNDDDNDDDKYEYYTGDFWVDCDYLYIGETLYNIVKIDNEIIISNKYFSEVLLNDITPKQQEKIITFYDNVLFKENKFNFKELSTWNHDIKESINKMSDSRISLKYRGGSGYYYSFWILQK